MFDPGFDFYRHSCRLELVLDDDQVAVFEPDPRNMMLSMLAVGDNPQVSNTFSKIVERLAERFDPNQIILFGKLS